MMAMNQFAHWLIPLRVQGQVLGPWGVIGLGGGVCVCEHIHVTAVCVGKDTNGAVRRSTIYKNF